MAVAIAAVCLAANPRLILSLALYAIFLVPLERMVPERTLRRRQWATDLIHAVATTSLIAVPVSVISVLLHASPLQGLAAPSLRGLPGALPLLLAMLTGELCHYWMHRAEHHFRLLWRFHSIHHSAEELDWLATARAHPVDAILNNISVLLPLCLAGASSPVLVLYGGFVAAQNVLAHSNVDMGFGPLRWVLVNPRFHRWHHASDRDAYNRNFAGQLPVIDRIFGTYFVPSGRIPAGFGVRESIPATWAGQMLHPLRGARRRRA